MPTFHYNLSEENCPVADLVGGSLDAETGVLVGHSVDEHALLNWCVRIAAAVVRGELSHNELVAEGVHMRITSSDGVVLLDTIAERTIRE